VTLNGREFQLNGAKFTPVGFNALWLGLIDVWINGSPSYPTKPQIEEMFIVAQQLGATTIRSHTLGITSGWNLALWPGPNTQTLTASAWEPIDYAFWMANRYNIKLIVPLTDGYTWFNGNYAHFCPPGVGKDQFWTDSGARANFKRAVSQWLNHVNQFTGVPIKDDPALMLIEHGNELGNIRPDHGSNTIPTREWIVDITNYIKTIDRNHLVLNGADESLGQSDEFNIQSIDCYRSHYYSKDYSRIDRDANRAAGVGKPYIIGEYDSKWGSDWFSAIEARPNVKGTFAWSLYPHQGGFLTGPPIAHDDGYTLHYPENNAQLQLMAGHFSRMKAGE
jgi:mannan endo-1,4-beta-mannosidase